MDKRLSRRINEMSTSATLAMAAKTRELIEQGEDIIGLSLGEPDFTIPDFVKNAGIKAIQDDYHTYPPVDGYSDLKQAIINKFQRDNNLIYKPSQIVVSTGAKQALSNLTMVLLDEGDEVLLPAPYWVSYADQCKVAGGIPKEIATSVDNNFKVTPEALEEAITPSTKLIIYSSPCNPSGSVYSRKELRALADVLINYPDIIVISDEIYEYINFKGKHTSMAEFEDMYDRTVVVNGVSKAFAMTGWRIGYIGAPEWIARACNKMQGQVTSGANVIAQRAAIAALEATATDIKYMINAFNERRKLISSLVSDIKGFKTNKPEGAFYIFPDISYYFGKTLRGKNINTASDFSLYLLEEAKVATVTGEAFGDPNCIRLSYAASEKDIKEAIKRIKEVVAE